MDGRKILGWDFTTTKTSSRRVLSGQDRPDRCHFDPGSDESDFMDRKSHYVDMCNTQPSDGPIVAVSHSIIQVLHW